IPPRSRRWRWWGRGWGPGPRDDPKNSPRTALSAPSVWHRIHPASMLKRRRHRLTDCDRAMTSARLIPTSTAPEALIASFERAGYARVAPAILQPAQPFLALSANDPPTRTYLPPPPPPP